MMWKRIVCLANSRKISGRCIAGKEWQDGHVGGWIRPVSERPTEEVSEEERRYKDGRDPKVLDVMEVPIAEHRPNAFQTENYVIDTQWYWRRISRTATPKLDWLIDEPDTLWRNGTRTYHGMNDRVPTEEAMRLRNSLYFLMLANVGVRVFAPGTDVGSRKRRVQVVFRFKGIPYKLWVTDPVIERIYLQKPDGDYRVGECYATISLGEPHTDGYCYKLVAALITPDMVNRLER